jgi:ketosteroid isomerase-like protein
MESGTPPRDTASAMSEENVEIVRNALDAFNQGDWDATLKDAAPDFELDFSRATGPQHGVFRLHQIRGFLDEFLEPWESLRTEAAEFIEAGEHVVMPVTRYMRGRDGIEVTARRTWVCTIREGAVVRLCQFQEQQEALEAAGLRG